MKSQLRTPADVSPGDEIAGWTETPTNLDLFLLGTAYWTTHRIHYDQAWARREGYRDAVVTGVLMYGWIERALIAWAGSSDGIRRFSFRHTGFACVGDALRVSLRIRQVQPHHRRSTVEVGISITKTADETTILEGTAVVDLPTAEPAIDEPPRHESLPEDG